ncbi:MAG TPA: type III pantothenate kinase [Pirellulales bacterium]|jgi:type III pantothenate kinase
MSATGLGPFVAVDVGNTRVKLGLFASAAGEPLPAPTKKLDLFPKDDAFEQIGDWLAPLAIRDVSWWIGSVERAVAGRLINWLRERGANRLTMLASGDLPLVVSLPRPDRVGIDRLLSALAANQLRSPEQPAIVVNLGTAITVDLVSAAGAFCGGAIMPGITTSARAMHEFTDLLPLVEMWNLSEPPLPVGTATDEAMRAGLFWGAVGGTRELIARQSAELTIPPRIFLTGGAAPTVARLLTDAAEHVPHLTLAGVALAAAHISANL